MKEITVIKGEKVNLRLTKDSDLENYVRWDSSPMKAWDFDGPWYNDDLSNIIKGRKKFLQGDRDKITGFMEIESKEGDHLGWVNVYHKEDDPHMTEVGIDIVEDRFWGKGMGKEAFVLWVDYLFKNREFTRIGIETWSGNKSMMGLAESVGFIEEGRIRKGCFVREKFYDRIKMGILREEWDLIHK